MTPVLLLFCKLAYQVGEILAKGGDGWKFRLPTISLILKLQ